MIRSMMRYVWMTVLVVSLGGCDSWFGPDKEGEIRLSSELFGTESYYLFGYSFDDGEYYRYPYRGERIPDIINEAFRVVEGGDVVLLPGFNTPTRENGFAMIAQLESLESGRNYYREYLEVESGLQFETVSDTVELYQVWIQKTAANNYVKMLVKDIQTLEGESGNMYSEVTLEYSYQPNGSTQFPD